MPTRGPLTPAVYWRRRAMLAGTAVLLVVATVDLVNGDEDPPPAPRTAEQVVGTPTQTRTDPAGPVVGPTKKGRKKRRQQQGQQPTYTPPPAPEPPEPDGTCADTDVVVTPVMAPALAGRPVLVSLSLRTVTTAACTWQVGREHLAYKITSDGDDVWSSSECPGQVPEDAVVVRRDFITTYRLAWNARSSSLDCPGGMELVPPGDYEVQAAAIGGEPSDPVPFTLTEPVVREPLGPQVPAGADARPGRARDRDRDRDRDKNKPDRG